MKTHFLLGAFLLSSIVYSQVGINTATPDATLDVRAKNHNGAVTATDGVLVPRVNSLTVNGSVNGQLVYLITDAGSFTQGFYYWNGSAWTGFSGTGTIIGDTTSDVWVDNSGGTAVLSTKPVVIGSGTSANASAVLDMSAVTNKGILIPQVALASSTDQTTVATPKAGLLVYNTGTATNGIKTKGYYFWNGTEWRTIDNSSSITPTVTSINCNGASMSPKSFIVGTYYSGTMTVPYSGGNGGTYGAGTTTTVNGLSFTLRPGKLNSGSGNLEFDITGTPTTNSAPYAMTIPVNTSTVPFITAAQACNSVVGNNSTAEIAESAVMGSLTSTTNPQAGYELVATTPDGKYSVRVYDLPGWYYGDSSFQIRPNTSTSNISWNNAVQYYGNNNYVQSNTISTFGASPQLGKWYGTAGGSGDFSLQSTTINDRNCWSDCGIADGGFPNNLEWRRYSWTNADPTDKTMYEAVVMMGMTAQELANATNCPSGVCAKTKIYIKITQSSAN